MEIQVEDLLSKLKYQTEKLDSRYKAIIDICNEMEKIINDLQYDVHELDKELDKWNLLNKKLEKLLIL